jgi:hypothetical protein
MVRNLLCPFSMQWSVLVTLLACGCGRLGFDTVEDGAGVGSDAGHPVDAFEDLGDTDAPPVPPQELQLDGLVGHWSFDEGAGATAGEASGGSSLTLYGGAAWVPGVIGSAVSGDGIDDYVQTPSVDLSHTAVVTLAVWIHRTYSLASLHTLIEYSTDYNSSAFGFGLFPDNNTACRGLFVGLRGDLEYTTGCFPQPSSGTWHHFAIIYDKRTPGDSHVTLFIDGAMVTDTIDNRYPNSNRFGVEPLFLFARAGTSEFTAGILDELRLYDRALTAQEIQSLFELR